VGSEHTHSLPFEAYEPAGGQALSGGPVTVTFGTVRLLDSSRFAFHGDSEIEILSPGSVFVAARIGVQQTLANSRTTTEVHIEHQPAGGAYALVGGSKDFVVTRNATDGAHGSVRAEATLQVSEGDRIRIRGDVVNGAGTIVVVADATSLHAEFVAY
jgi:hypothetical protein